MLNSKTKGKIVSGIVMQIGPGECHNVYRIEQKIVNTYFMCHSISVLSISVNLAPVFTM